jgi:hypothetical protein
MLAYTAIPASKLYRRDLAAQNLSFLNKKSAAAYFSPAASGARYLNAIIVSYY